MKVILIKNFSQLGYKYEIVDVKRGYAMNFLIPSKIAVYATEANVKEAKENLKQYQHKIEKQREEARGIVKKLETVDFVYEVETNDQGELLKQINSTDIVKLIDEKTNYKINRKDVKFINKIDKIGKHQVKLVIFKEIVATINLEVKMLSKKLN